MDLTIYVNSLFA